MGSLCRSRRRRPKSPSAGQPLGVAARNSKTTTPARHG
jgi:hypothetical protein